MQPVFRAKSENRVCNRSGSRSDGKHKQHEGD